MDSKACPVLSGGDYLMRLNTRLVVVVFVVAVVVAGFAAEVAVVVAVTVEVGLTEAVELGVGLFGPFSALLFAALLPGAL